MSELSINLNRNQNLSNIQDHRVDSNSNNSSEVNALQNAAQNIAITCQSPASGVNGKLIFLAKSQPVLNANDRTLQESLNKYVAKSYEMHKAGYTQAKNATNALNTLIKGVAAKPFEIAISDDQLKDDGINNSIKLKGAPKFERSSPLYNIQKNLESFMAIAQGARPTVRATCGANAVAYLNTLLTSMSDTKLASIISKTFSQTALTYLACEDKKQASQLENNLNQVNKRIKQICQDNFDKGIAKIFECFTKNIVSQKNDSLNFIDKVTFHYNGINTVDISKVENLFEVKNKGGKITIDCPKISSISSFGAIATGRFEALSNYIQGIKETAQKTLDDINNSRLDEAAIGINNLSAYSDKIVNVLKGPYENKVKEQTNNLVNRLLTPESVRNLNNNPTSLSTTQYDLSDFDATHDEDLFSLYKDISALSSLSGNRFDSLVFQISGPSSPLSDNLTMNSDVYNGAVDTISSFIQEHSGFDKAKKDEILALKNEIAQLKNKLNTLTLDPIGAINELKTDYTASEKTIGSLKENSAIVRQLAKQNFVNSKNELNNQINNKYKLMATVLKEGLHAYVTNHINGNTVAQSTLKEHGISENAQLGAVNGGVKGLLDATSFNNMSGHALAPKQEDAKEHVIMGLLNAAIQNTANLPEEDIAPALDVVAPKKVQSNGVESMLETSSAKTPAKEPSSSSKTPTPLSQKQGNHIVENVLKRMVNDQIAVLRDESADKDAKLNAFNQSKRITGVYAALGNNLVSIAHSYYDANHTKVFIQSYSDDNVAFSQAWRNISEDQLLLEVEEFLNDFQQRFNSDLCMKLITTGFKGANKQTLDNIATIADLLENCYDDDKSKARILNLKTSIDLIGILKSNYAMSIISSHYLYKQENVKHFKEFQFIHEIMHFFRDPTLQNVRKMFDYFIDTPSNLVLTVGEDMFMDEAQKRYDSYVLANGSNPEQSVEQIAQSLAKAEEERVNHSFQVLLNNKGIFLDLLYSMYKTDAGIICDTYEPCDDNASFYKFIDPYDHKKTPMLSFIQEYRQKINPSNVKLADAIVQDLVNQTNLPIFEKIVDDFKGKYDVINKRNNALDHFFNQVASNDDLAKFNHATKRSAANAYEMKHEFLAKALGSDSRLIGLGLAHGLEENFGLEVDSTTSTREYMLAKTSTSEEKVKELLSNKAYENNLGETQAASIKMALALSADSEFTSADITNDLVNKYMGAKNVSEQSHDQGRIKSFFRRTGFNNVKERDVFWALEGARNNPNGATDCATLVRSLYKEYQQHHKEFANIPFNSLSTSQYKGVLNSYYGIFKMNAPIDLLLHGPRTIKSTQSLSPDQKAKIFEKLSHAIISNNDVLFNSNKSADKAIKDSLKPNFDTVVKLYNAQNKAPLTVTEQKALNEALGAIYITLSNSADLLKVCDFVMMNKSVTNSQGKNATSTSQTQNRMLAKVFGNKSINDHNNPNNLGTAVSNLLAFNSVQQNYINSDEVKIKTNMVKLGEMDMMSQINEDPKCKALYDAGLHMAMIDIAELYGKSDPLDLIKDFALDFTKSHLVNNDKQDTRGAHALKTKLPLNDTQIASLIQKGINCITVDSKGAIISSSIDNDEAVSTNKSNDDIVSLKITKDESGNKSIVFMDILSAQLANNINVKDHNEQMLNLANELEYPKESGKFKAKVPGLVTSQDIANGIVNVAVRDSSFGTEQFFNQLKLQTNINRQKKADLAKEHCSNFIEACKTDGNFKEKYQEVALREQNKLNEKNLGILSDMLFLMENNSAFYYDKNQKLQLAKEQSDNLFSSAKVNLSKFFNRSKGDDFSIIKSNGKYTITLKKELAQKINSSLSLGIENTIDELAQINSSNSDNLTLDKDNTDNTKIITVNFTDHEKAALFLQHVMLHQVTSYELQHASVQDFIESGAVSNFEVNSSMIVSANSATSSEQINTVELEGVALLAQDPKNKSAVESNKQCQDAMLSCQITGTGKQYLIDEQYYQGYKDNVSGSIKTTSTIQSEQLIELAANNQSSKAVSTIDYDINTTVKCAKISEKISASRVETYKIKSDSDLATVLSIQGMSKDLIDCLLSVSDNVTFNEISISSQLDPNLKLKLEDPKFKQKDSYNTVSVEFKYTPKSASTNSQSYNTNKFISFDVSFLQDNNNEQAILDFFAPK